jgi:transcriptional regulator with XRE-family HTH domain
MADNPLTLHDYIRFRLQELQWTQGKLAQVSGVSEGSISNLLNQKAVPETRTIERLADALDVPRPFMLTLLAQEHTEVVPEPQLHPMALHLAHRLTALPEEIREAALAAIAGVIELAEKRS